MTEDAAPSKGDEADPALIAIQREVSRKKRAAQAKKHSAWFGLGMFGLIGWAVAVPTVIGAGIGLWIDRAAPSSFSWTLALLLAGVTLGCLNAWYWIASESRDD